MSQAEQQAIIRAAQDAGIDPSAALAIAERESNFDPNARSSKTIRGMYQMTGNLRQQYGIGDSSDPETQARGWAIFFKDNKGEMARVLGRDPTDAEGYLGHHFGSVRAARMMRMDPNTPVDQVFTPYEMSVNPHFARAGTVGNLNASVTSDITRRQAKFGGTAEAPDLAEFGTPVDDSGPDYQGNFDRNKKWSKSGNYRTDLGEKEAEFQKWVQDNKIPFDVRKTGPDDYDMRGFWKGAQEGDPRANTSPNPNDHQIHYDDKWKTPYHKSFSNESQWAKPNAPTWNDKDQLIDPATGGVVYDEKAPAPAPQPQSKGPVDLSQFGTVASQGPDPEPQPQPSAPVAQSAPDLASLGTPVA